MTSSELEGRPPRPEPLRTAGGSGAAQDRDGRVAPARPSLSGKSAAPVLVKLPPPVSVRLSELSWILSLVVGAVAVVYLFVIRQNVQPEIIEMARGVDASRAEETYTALADILFWCVFGAFVAVLLVQLTLLVSFANRRHKTRWGLFATLLFQALAFLLAREFVVRGEHAGPLEQILLIQLGLAALGLLFSLLPGAVRWTARQRDVRPGGLGGEGGSADL